MQARARARERRPRPPPAPPARAGLEPNSRTERPAPPGSPTWPRHSKKAQRSRGGAAQLERKSLLPEIAKLFGNALKPAPLSRRRKAPVVPPRESNSARDERQWAIRSQASHGARAHPRARAARKVQRLEGVARKRNVKSRPARKRAPRLLSV